MYLTQQEADYLMELEKTFDDKSTLELGVTPMKFSRQLTSIDKRERFIFDVWRGSLNLQKYRLQERGRSIIVLVRVDVAGAPHRNPDEKLVACPHIHSHPYI